MRGAGVNFDFRRQVRLCEGLFENVLFVGRPHIVVGRDCNEELRLGLRGLDVRTVWGVYDQSAAME